MSSNLLDMWMSEAAGDAFDGPIETRNMHTEAERLINKDLSGATKIALVQHIAEMESVLQNYIDMLDEKMLELSACQAEEDALRRKLSKALTKVRHLTSANANFVEVTNDLVRTIEEGNR